MLAIAALLAIHASLAGSIPAAPENITVTFLNPTSVRVSWQTSVDLHTNPVDKYDVTYKPTDARVVAVVAGNSEAVILGGLSPDTQYQLTVAAIWSGKKYRSRPIVFRTLEPPRTSPQQDSGVVVGSGDVIGSPGGVGGGIGGPPISPHAESGPALHGFTDEFGNLADNSTVRELPTIRGVEIGIVVLVLIVWAGAIALFFNRWGKIRMLLPYQPDYKQEQLKVPGTGVCATGACTGQHSHQHFHHWSDEPSTAIAERCQRNRINSAIFVSSEGKGFDSIEFLRRHGSMSVLCRKAKSADNINATERQRRFSEHPDWCEIETDNTSLQQQFQQHQQKHQPLQQQHTYDKEPPTTTVELVECHNVNEASTSRSIALKQKPKLNNLPTLSVSSPSPPHEEEIL